MKFHSGAAFGIASLGSLEACFPLGPTIVTRQNKNAAGNRNDCLYHTIRPPTVGRDDLIAPDSSFGSAVRILSAAGRARTPAAPDSSFGLGCEKVARKFLSRAHRTNPNCGQRKVRHITDFANDYPRRKFYGKTAREIHTEIRNGITPKIRPLPPKKWQRKKNRNLAA